MKASTIKFYEVIRKEFNKLSMDKTLKTSYIIKKLSLKYFLSERTIENIIFNRV